MKTIKKLRIAIENEKTRSAWSKGVKEYALELIEDFEEDCEFYGNIVNRKG